MVRSPAASVPIAWVMAFTGVAMPRAISQATSTPASRAAMPKPIATRSEDRRLPLAAVLASSETVS